MEISPQGAERILFCYFAIFFGGKKMLTARENLIELLEHGTPDRIVNQFEAIPFVINPFLMKSEYPEKGAKEPVADLWGVYYAFPENVPASFPLQDENICW